jgi:NAD(P)-dependent dehydrogenase (short-subunit alcohol dehydrogenase family)
MVAGARSGYHQRMSKHASQNAGAPKVILVTGASSGIGWATAERFHLAGHKVFGTSRSAEARGPAGVTMVALDVEHDESVQACIRRVLDDAGRVDVLVSNAGRLVFGPSEEVPLADAQRLFETNFWGSVRVVNALLPGMRARRAGQVILVGSMSAWVTMPLNAFYSASKAALARYAEALRHETMHLGIQVALVEPSEIATPFWERGLKVPSRFSDYLPIREPIFAGLPSLFAGAPQPARLAAVIEAIAGEADPKPIYRFGGLARRMPWMRVLVPARAFERGFRKQFGLGTRSHSPGE